LRGILHVTNGDGRRVPGVEADRDKVFLRALSKEKEIGGHIEGWGVLIVEDESYHWTRTKGCLKERVLRKNS